MQKLNVGCGFDIREGWINLDSAKLEGVDVVHDLSVLPFPFEDNSMDEIACQDVLEHVEYPVVLQELHRILKPGGELTIRVPHFTCYRNYVDPTHIKRFSIQTFDFFVKENNRNRDYYFPFAFSKLKKKELLFQKNRYLFLNPLVEKVIRSSRKIRDLFYEQSFLSRLFPAESIVVILIK